MGILMHHYEKALEIAHKVGDRRSIGDVLSNLGSMLWFQGHLDEAGEYYEKSLAKQ
ncbi:MAG: tetratricopeptide repeat protein [Candidatus Aegiribacteria sp.]|nr:tetratricopeptide repeat protein [Candidatus Aegiribacteria sp.]